MKPSRAGLLARSRRLSRTRPADSRIPERTSTAQITTDFSAVLAPVDADLAPADVGLVDLDQPVQELAAGADHRPAQLVQVRPGGLVGAEAHDPLEAERRHSLLLGDELPDRREPGQKGVRVPAKSVPAVTEVWRSQARQTQRPRFVRQASFEPQAGQRKPAGQRSRSR